MKPADIERIKEILPTDLGSEEIRGTFAAEILQRSVFSAHMASAPYLKKVRELCTQLIAGEINEATVRAGLETCLAQMGHSPLDDGGITNPASIRRLNLIIDTQRQMATNVSKIAQQTSSTVKLFPAWQLTRLETRAVPRTDWMARWRAAGDACGWEGAVKEKMVALKSSPIWQELGNGAGGFTDCLGNPYPPFAFSSGLDWVDVPRETCIRLGLTPDSSDLPDVSLSPGERDIADALERYGEDCFGKDLDILERELKMEDFA